MEHETSILRTLNKFKICLFMWNAFRPDTYKASRIIFAQPALKDNSVCQNIET